MKKIGWKHHINTKKIDWIDRYIDSSKTYRILDLGPGKGWYSKYLSSKGHEVVAIDKDPRFEDANIEIHDYDLEKGLHFNKSEFDYILAWDIIEHISNENQLIKDIHRVLKVDGIVLVSVPNSKDELLIDKHLTFIHHKDKTHKRAYTKEKLINNFENVGFKNINTKLQGGEIYPYLVINFIRFRSIKIIMYYMIKALYKMSIIRIGECHGDIFSALKK